MTRAAAWLYRRAMRSRLFLVVAVVGGLLLSVVTAASAQTATLTFEQIFGSVATNLTVPFGSVDASCISVPGSGITCVPDLATNGATWYGNIQFSVKLTGSLHGVTVRLTAARQSGGSIPAGRLLDGASGVPATSYPTSPASPIVLKTAVGSGAATMVSRSIGLKVIPSDVAGSWSTATVYSLIVE